MMFEPSAIKSGLRVTEVHQRKRNHHAEQSVSYMKNSNL